jgi:predicted porin
MKKSLVALALFGAFASVAQAQSSVVIYGALDAGFSHTSPSAAGTPQNTIGAIGDNNKLGFKGVEDLGNGLKALFQIETRFLPDTGTLEGISATNSATRPLFQGESRVGLQGAFGTVRLGRGKTAWIDSNAAFEPWSGAGNTGAGFQADLQVASFNSDPLTTSTVGSKNRISNAAFYNSPVFAGFQANVSVATKEDITNAVADTAVATKVPFSTSVTYNMGMVGAMVAYERNAIDDHVWSVAASVTPITNLKLMASFQKQDQAANTVPTDQKAWVLGANYTMGAGKLLAGYGQSNPDMGAEFRKASVGYQYSLSKRTYVYADVSKKKQDAVVGTPFATDISTKYFGAGVHHNF